MDIAKYSLFFKQVLLTDSNVTLNLTDSLTWNGRKKDGACYCNLAFISKLIKLVGNLNFAQLVAYTPKWQIGWFPLLKSALFS